MQIEVYQLVALNLAEVLPISYEISEIGVQIKDTHMLA